MEKNNSPFTLDRFEYERSNLYYLPKNTFELLEREKPTYIIGSRGTGKTTLLHALNWKERLNNESLRSLITEPFENCCIGLYMRVPHFNVDSFNKWLENDEDDIRGSIFGLYIDLVWTELICEAVADLIVERYFIVSPDDEYHLTNSIFNQFPELSDIVEFNSYCTIRNLKKLIYSLRRKIENYAKLRVDPKEVLEFFPSGQVGELGRGIASAFAQFCDKFSSNEGSKWHFKVCMDETECLSSFQQRVINTIVRLSEGNVIFVVSYVREIDDLNNTLIKGLALQKADRQLLNLDILGDKEFQDLAEGVAKVRIQKKLNLSDINFKTQDILGSLNINFILKTLLEESESAYAKNLLKESQKCLKEPFFQEMTLADVESPQKKTKSKKILPIYQTYLIEKLKLNIPSPDKEKWERRSQDSAEIRKRMVAAYLCLCKELKKDVWYAFDKMVFQMSDKCIRDFLSQMHEIFIETNLPIDKFITTKCINIRKQNDALKRASLQKKEFLPLSGITAPYEVGRLVDGLAQITATVQSSGPDNKALRTHERGRFVVDIRNSSNINILSLIKEAGEAGFLKIFENEGYKWKFQVHCSLASAYGFSYRGAYHPTPISIKELELLAKTEDKEELSKTVAKIGQRLSGTAKNKLDQRQLSLFKEFL